MSDPDKLERANRKVSLCEMKHASRVSNEENYLMTAESDLVSVDTCANTDFSMTSRKTDLCEKHKKLNNSSEFGLTCTATAAFSGWCNFSWRNHSIAQAPTYPCDASLFKIEEELQQANSIVDANEVYYLRQQMKRVVQEKGFLLQVGDCAETFRHSDVGYTTQRISLFSELHRLIQKSCKGPVLMMGRMAGQFAKPRTEMTETVDGVTVSSYFGDVINGYELDNREPDPERLIIGHNVASDTVGIARLFCHTWSLFESTPFIFGEHFFTCHEAYLLPYEQNLLRRHERVANNNEKARTVHRDIEEGSVYSMSAHFLWIGERTRNLDGGHIAFVQSIANPIGIKIGAKESPEGLLGLIDRLNPDGIPGRLCFIYRLGASDVDNVLERYATALVKANKHNHIMWLCDPMHGNTKRTQAGMKTRKLKDIRYEIDRFFSILHDKGITPGGLHLEVTPQKIYECLDDHIDESTLSEDTYLTTCDPRLNADQVVSVVDYVASLIQKYSDAVNNSHTLIA